jgi:phenylacetate-coenzyme A ligase PaaK-like adenylate-forming protein
MTTRDDLYKIGAKPLLDYQEDGRAKNYYLRMTSGTSGKGPIFVAKDRSLETELRGNEMYKDLIAPVMCIGQNNARLALLTHFLFFNPRNDRRVLILESKDLDENLGSILDEFKPDSLCGFPSFIISALLKINDMKILKRIGHLRFVGEGLSKMQQEIIKEKVPHAKIKIYYASVETGYLSAPPCLYLKLNQYHPANGVEIKIISQDDEGRGEIVISANISRSVKLENYLIGDIGRFLPGKCKCGSELTFEVLGRKNFDYLKIAGAVIRQEVLEEALQKIGGIADFRAEASEVIRGEKLLGRLVLNLAVNNKSGIKKEALAEKISSRLFLTPSQTYKQLIDGGFFLPLQIEFTDSFPAKVKNVKLKKV